MYAVTRTLCRPSYHHNDSVHCFNHTSCAQAQELQQSHCGDNWEGTLHIVFMITFIYIYIYYQQNLQIEKT